MVKTGGTEESIMPDRSGQLLDYWEDILVQNTKHPWELSKVVIGKSALGRKCLGRLSILVQISKSQ